MRIQREKNNGLKASGIDYYINDYGVSVEEAIDKFQEMVENAWKDTNEDILGPIPPAAISNEILMRILNFARVDEVIYMHGQDNYTYPEKKLKHYIIALFVDSFEI